MKRFGFYIFFLLVSGPLSLYVGNESLRFLGLGALVVGFFSYFFSKGGRIYIGSILNKADFWALSSVVGIYGISLVRTQSGDASLIGSLNLAVQAILLALLVYLFYSREFRGGGILKNKGEAIFQLYWPIGLLILVNVAGYFLGLQPPKPPGSQKDSFGQHEHESVIASLLGLDLDRTGFFLTGHPNGFGLLVGWGIVMGALMLIYGKFSRFQKRFLYVSLGSEIFALLILDSRGTMGSALACILMAVGLERVRMTSFSKVIVWVVPVISLSITYLLQVFAESGTASSISRNEGELATGNGRAIFWEYCADELAEFKDEHIWGFGQNGHISSGVALKYEWFLGYPAYTHNFIYQTILDMGYLGLGSLLIMMYITTSNGVFFMKKRVKDFAVFMVFPTYFQLTGIFEATFGQFNTQYTFVFILFATASVVFVNEYLKSQLEKQSEPSFLPTSTPQQSNQSVPETKTDQSKSSP